MCTLSWQIHKEQLQIVFNRDELYSRESGLPPVKQKINGITVVSPVDPESGGTWIAVNDHGYLYCLLNDYEYDQSSENEKNKISRGNLIRELSVISCRWELRKKIKSLDPTLYKPFKVLVFPDINPPLQWTWDGRSMSEIIAPPQVVSSSSFSQNLAEKFRHRIFSKETNGFLEPMPISRQEQLHRKRRPWPPAISIAMKRSDRATVSLTSVIVSRQRIEMKYQPGDPVSTNHPETQVTLDRVRSDEPGFKFIHPDESGKNPVDIDKIFRKKNPEFHDRVPNLLFKILRKVVKEVTINNGLNKIANIPSNHFSATVLNHLQVSGRLDAVRTKLPPGQNRPVFLANHPTGGIDGLILLSWLTQYYPDIKLLGNDVLGEVPHMRPYLVPVDRFGGSLASVRYLFEVFESDIPLIIFPAGNTARKENGKLTDKPWQKMPVQLAYKTGRSIMPIFIQAENSFVFYGTATARQALNLNLNIEMMLLPREFLKPACKEFALFTGPELSPGELDQLGSNDQEKITALQHMCEQLSDKQIHRS